MDFKQGMGKEECRCVR